jgi:hypothetical protein
MYKTFRETEPYGEMNADCTNPDSLTSFINEAAPPAWSPSSFNFILPEDDMSDIPTI